MAKYKHVRTLGHPRIAVLRRDLAATSWTLRPKSEDDIEPFLAAAAAALETEPSDHFSRLTITPLWKTHKDFTAVIPIYDEYASQVITNAEQKLLAFLKETGVLPPEAGLQELCQWGQANDLPYRIDLRREAKNLYKNAVINEVLPGMKVAQYGGSVAHAAAQAVDPSVLGPGGGIPFGRSERRLLGYLKQTGELPAHAGRIELCRWGRSHGLYRRIDIECAGAALRKSGIPVSQLETQASATARRIKSAKVKKRSPCTDGDGAAQKDRRLEADESLHSGGSVVQNASMQPMPGVERTFSATIEKQSSSLQKRGLDRDIEVPGLAERLAERGELTSTRTETPMEMDQSIDRWHSSEPSVGIKQAGESANATAAQFAANKKAREKMQEQLASLKKRSLIDSSATVEHLPAWKQANVVVGEGWESTLKRVESEQAHLKDDVGMGMHKTVQIPSKENFDSSEPKHQLDWFKDHGLLSLDKGVADMVRWREANANEGEKFSDFAMRMLTLPPTPSRKQKDQLQRLKQGGLLGNDATVQDMLRWGEANAGKGENLKAVIKRLEVEHSRRQFYNIEMLAQAERNHVDGTLEEESQEVDPDKSSSEDEDVKFILE